MTAIIGSVMGGADIGVTDPQLQPRFHNRPTQRHGLESDQEAAVLKPLAERP